MKKANESPQTQGEVRNLDANAVKQVRRALCEAAEALSANKLLAQHPWSAGHESAATNDEHTREALESAVAFTDQLLVRAAQLEKLDPTERAALFESLSAFNASDASTLSDIALKVGKDSRPAIDEAGEEIRRFGKTLAEELRHELPAADVSDIKRYLEGYIHARFEERLRELTERAGTRVENIVDEAQTIINDNWNRHATEALGPVAAKLDLRIDSFRFDVGVMALSAVGLSLMFSNLLLGGLLTLAAPAAAFALKGKLDQQSKRRAEREVPTQVELVADRLANELTAALAASVAALCARLKQYGALWPEALLETLQATDASRSRLEDARSALSRAKKALA